jgi:hypothetical protein
MGGRDGFIDILRLRAFTLGIQIPLLFSGKALRDLRGNDCAEGDLDLFCDLNAQRYGPTLTVAAVCDLLGMDFTSVFEQWRHDAEAVAQLIAVATGDALAASGRAWKALP